MFLVLTKIHQDCELCDCVNQYLVKQLKERTRVRSYCLNVALITKNYKDVNILNIDLILSKTIRQVLRESSVAVTVSMLQSWLGLKSMLHYIRVT